MSDYINLSSTFKKIIDYRGKTPKKLGHEWSRAGYRALSALNVKTDGLTNLENIKYGDEALYRKWMKDEIKKGDILLTSEAPAGQVMVWSTDEKIILSQRLFALRLKDEFDSYFLKYYLQSNTGQAEIFKNTSGSTVFGISAKMFDLIKLPNFSLDVQQKIAAVLSVLDNKIELNRKINAELEQMARTLYDYWFVQFDFPNTDGKPYKTSGGPMKFSPELNRQIPTDWEAQDMSTNDLFDIIKPKINHFTDTKEYIATADVNDLTIGNGSQINYETRESRANMQPKEYTVWFAKMKASVKHILVGDYSTDLIQNAIFSTGFMGMQTTKENFEYLALTIHRPYFELVKDANSNGATMEAIGNSSMKNIKLLVPNEDTIKEFHKITQPLLEKIDRNRQQSQNLATLRDWLLPMLMNGQVSVK